MKKIKATSKIGQKLTNAYWNSHFVFLHDVYDRYSNAKLAAYEYCRRLMIEEKGWDFRIISANTFQFTCGFQTDHGLRIETRENSYTVTDLPF